MAENNPPVIELSKLRLGEMERDVLLDYSRNSFRERPERNEPKSLDERYSEYIDDIKRHIPEGENIDDEKLRTIYSYEHFLNFLVAMQKMKQITARVRVIPKK